MAIFNGMRVDITHTAVAKLPEERWDWSAYRSPSRARRRRDCSKVVKTEPACFQVADKLICHPTIWERLRATLSTDTKDGGGPDAGR